MVPKLTDLLIIADKNQPVFTPRTSSLTIFAIDQPIWITQPGRIDDIILWPNQKITMDGRKQVIVQTLGDRTQIRLLTPTPLVERIRRYLVRTIGSGDSLAPTPRP